jgi:hypothetical protein
MALKTLALGDIMPFTIEGYQAKTAFNINNDFIRH